MGKKVAFCKRETVTAEEFKAWLQRYEIMLRLAGKLFCVSHNTVGAWSRGTNPVPGPIVLLMRIFENDLELLRQELRRAESELEQDRTGKRRVAA